jgi:uncharacterized protein YcbX
MRGEITRLYHYPVKGFSPHRLESVELEPSRGFPFDRTLALARHDSECDPSAFRPLPKTRFHMLARDAALAKLTSRFTPESGHLRIEAGEGAALETDLSTPKGAGAFAAFIARQLGVPAEETPFLVDAGENRYTDVSVISPEMMNAVSLINLASVRDFEAKTGLSIDPMRFRANIYFDGWPAWSEFEMDGVEIVAGDVTLRPCLRTKRCPATQVDPATAARDIDVPALLMQHYGHPDLGIYAEVVSGGVLTDGLAFTRQTSSSG